MADGHLNFDTKIDESGFNEGTSKLGSLAKGGLAVLGAAIAGVVAGFGAITKAALDSVASLEQNMGGVETLFGSHADRVIANAKRAYETAGMSANQYMSTVTSFSASLLQSLKGDTEAAVEYADRAIIDMSDNANKMGTSIESIQWAYQGFAKQNYTMLDNLKLGYGGTRAEMERLIADANKVKEANGEMADLSIDSFADVTEAIHIIQEEMGITGTTAKEAAATIEGSMNAAKAAWDNFLNGTISAEDFSEAVTTAVVNVVNNLEEIVPRLLETIPLAAKGIYEGISDALDGEAMINGFVDGMNETLPAVADAGLQIIGNLIDGITQNSEGIATKGIEIVLNLADKIVSSLPTLLSAGLQMIMSLAKGIIDNLPVLIEKVPEIINAFFDALWGFIPQLIAAGLQLIVQLGIGIIKSIPTIIANAGEIVKAILNVMAGFSLFKIGKTIIATLGEGIVGMTRSIGSIAKSIGESIKETFTSVNWAGVGIAIVQGVAAGIKSGATAIINAARNAAKNALSSAKKALGIHSPSTVFRDEVGKYMAEGIGVGFEENVPTGEMNDALKASVNRMQMAVAEQTSAPNVLPGNAHLLGHMDTKEDPPESTGDTYEIHVHSHIDGHELVEETIVITDEELGKRNVRKERGNAG